ncbi:MAG: PQQ-binding-like beta-propeller repeat protein [Spirochaetota bacterium]
MRNSLLTLALAAGALFSQTTDWPSWRGPLHTGVSAADPTTTWSETKNIKWKTVIPGRGHSSPIIWKGKIYLTTAIETGKAADVEKVKAVEAETPEFHRKSAHLPAKSLAFAVVAVNAADGKIVWKESMLEEIPFSATHADGSWASGSSTTDGEHLYTYFGSYGLYCLDMNGKKIWSKRFGLMKMKANFGEGISPVLSGDLVIMNLDQESGSALVALDKKTGAEKWRVTRDEQTSWSTPLVVSVHGKTQIVVSATKKIRSYDAHNGTLIWECAGMTGNVIPCPVFDGKNVICMSGFRGASLLAIDIASAKGDITDSKSIVWSKQKDTPYVPSPVLADGLLYYLKANDGVITCVRSADGAVQYGPQKLEDMKQIFSSPIAAGKYIYLFGKDGTGVVLAKGSSFKVISVNKLDDGITASPAAIGGDLIVRGHTKLYCIANGK